MAKHAIAVRRAPSVPKSKYENIVRLQSSAKKRAKEMASERIGIIVAAGAGAAIGLAEKKGTALPTVGGIQPTILYGAILAFVVPEMTKGKLGRMSAEAGAGLLTLGAYKLATGAPLRVGEDDEAYT